MWKFITFATFSIIWAIMAANEFEGLEKAKPGSCNTTLSTEKNHSNGGFHSGAFNKTSGVYCIWNISAVTTKKPITLFFFHLYLHDLDEVNVYKYGKNDTLEALAPPFKASNGSMALITEELFVQIVLTGTDTGFLREFEGFFSIEGLVAIPPSVYTIYSPIYANNVFKQHPVIYRFDDVQHVQAIQVFSFEKSNMSTGSTVNIEGGSYSGDYKFDSPVMDIYNTADDNKPLMITVTMAANNSDYFKLHAHEVDKRCSLYIKLDNEDPPKPLRSPQAMLNNGSIVNECRWVIEHTGKKILGLQFGKLDFTSVFDIVAVNDGLSEFSTPLLQVTTSNKNVSHNQIIRSSGSQLWVSFKPVDYTSSFEANVTIHGQGGYYRNNGTINMVHTDGNDTVFLLEVEEEKKVFLEFDDSSLPSPATLDVYDGFDESNLLTSLHGQIKFPVISKSSQMMIIGKGFSSISSHFIASFKGIVPGCNHMSSMDTENYVLSENCNSSCTWVIPPQDSLNSRMLLLNLQYVSLNKGDMIKIYQLDSNVTQLGLVTANQNHVPHIAVPATVGLLVNITQANCEKKKDKIVLIGHSSYIPDCGSTVSLNPSEKYQISSPLYPDTYPLFASCQWKISVKAGSFIHMTFDNLKLAENHCVKIFHNSSKKYEYDGKILPKDDLFLSNDSVVEFDSTNCSKPRVGQLLNSAEGFLLNATAADCGGILEGKKDGEFNTSISGNSTICIWKVSVPPTEGDSVNVISYTMNKDSLKNCELKVYDGSSVRDPEIINSTESDVWSRTNSLIFVYTRVNASQPSTVLHFKYGTISCNTTMQCANKKCMHPDWKCNGIDDCGDNSDERNCASVPVPPEIKFTGYSGTAFWFCVFAMLMVGVIIGVIVPICYQKWKDSRYTRFRELSGIDG